MRKSGIYWKTALKKLSNNEMVTLTDIDFKKETIKIQDVILFNSYGIKVPEELIVFEDEKIDCSDIPEISVNDIESGKLINVIPAQIKVDPETAEWIKKSKINYNELLSSLLYNFYQSVKSLSGKAAV
jgi:hypothetical protein